MASHITSSEFWPITISKTWLTPSQFETSMLQKPLLTLFLSFFHLIKMPDVVHVALIKLIFSAFCTFGLYIFIKFVFKRTGHNPRDTLSINIVAGLFVLSSPTFIAYFFSIRSDQVACVLFSLFLLFCEDKRPRAALAALALIPLFGIKEILFLIPGAIYYLLSFKISFSRKELIYLMGVAITALVWVVALNIPFLYYLFEAYEATNYLSRFSSFYYKHEMYLLLTSVIASGYLLWTRQKEHFKDAGLGLMFLFLLLVFPQSYFFYMSSLLPFIYLPLFIVLLKAPFSQYAKIGMIAVQVTFVLYGKVTLESKFFDSVFDQYGNIVKASKFVEKHRLTYMDGMGILPQQKFYSCFVSPYDEQAKFNCLNPRKAPDVVIITNRLAGLGPPIFEAVEKNYTQIFPNLWVLNSSLNSDILNEKDLSPRGLPLPILIF
ncbi:MAG: hypothetical protein K0R29_283 [Pseudobdellovibrio sp.]|nr:hypothetical protein [Pseudobdellovibrio sp.]